MYQADLVDDLVAFEPRELLGAMHDGVGVQLDADVLRQLVHIHRSAQPLEECHKLQREISFIAKPL